MMVHQSGQKGGSPLTDAGTVAWSRTGCRVRHSSVVLSNARGLTATVNRAIATPDGVNRNSGLSVRLPTTVITVELSTGQPVPAPALVWVWTLARWAVARTMQANAVRVD